MVVTLLFFIFHNAKKSAYELNSDLQNKSDACQWKISANQNVQGKCQNHFTHKSV